MSANLFPGRIRRSPSPRSRSYRSRLEALEDRTLLSTAAPDPTFGGGAGTTTASFNNASATLNAVALLSNGDILAVGEATSNNVSNWALEAFRPDGSIDSSFGTNAHVITPFSGTDSEAFAVAVDPVTGIIWVAGRAGSTGTGTFGLADYLPNGQPGQIGAGTGKVTTQFGNDDAAFGMALQLGEPVVVGEASTNNGDFAVARYDIGGNLDGRFGSGGKVTTDFSNGSIDEAHAVAIQPDQKIVVVGQTLSPGTGNTVDFALVRYNADGSLDPSFGNGGNVQTDFAGKLDIAASVALQADGKIVVAGYSMDASGHDEFSLARYLPNGDLDFSFGQRGKVNLKIAPTRDDVARSIAIQPDGKIVVAGYSTSAGTTLFVVARYNPDGTVDHSFGGVGLTEPVVTGTDRASSMALQPDGKIIVAGTSTVNGNGEFAVVRLENDHLQFGAPTYSVSESGSAATITITRVGGVTGTVSALLTTSDGSAGAGTDHVPVSTRVVFGTGETSKTVTIPILGDGLVDGNETVDLTLSNPSNSPGSETGLGSPDSALLTIADSASGTPVDVTPLLSVVPGKVHPDPATGRAVQKVMIRNLGGQAVWGPLTLVLDGLKRKVKVRHAAGRTGPSGSPFVTFVPGRSDQLAARAGFVIVVRFSDPLDLPIRYTPRILSGAGVS
jgi:uncharacterized delta-60 repeat protein